MINIDLAPCFFFICPFSVCPCKDTLRDSTLIRYQYGWCNLGISVRSRKRASISRGEASDLFIFAPWRSERASERASKPNSTEHFLRPTFTNRDSREKKRLSPRAGSRSRRQVPDCIIAAAGCRQIAATAVTTGGFSLKRVFCNHQAFIIRAIMRR